MKVLLYLTFLISGLNSLPRARTTINKKQHDYSCEKTVAVFCYEKHRGHLKSIEDCKYDGFITKCDK